MKQVMTKLIIATQKLQDLNLYQMVLSPKIFIPMKNTILIAVILISLLSLPSISRAQKPDPGINYRVFEAFFDTNTNNNAHHKGFIEVNEIVFLDTLGLEHMAPAKKDSIKNTEKKWENMHKEFNSKGGNITMPPSETSLRFIDSAGRNLSLNKYQKLLTRQMEKELGRKFTVVLQFFVHYSGEVAGVKLLRYDKENAVHKSKVMEFLTSYPWNNVQAISERHFNVKVSSINNVIIGYD